MLASNILGPPCLFHVSNLFSIIFFFFSMPDRHELYWWRYQFCFLKARVYFLMNEIAGSLLALNQGASLAEQRGDFDLKV